MNSSILAVIISVIILSVFFWIATKRNKKLEAKMDANDFIIRKPKLALVLGILFILFFVFTLIIYTTSEDVTINDPWLMEDHITIEDSLPPEDHIGIENSAPQENLTRFKDTLLMSVLLLFGLFVVVSWYRWKIIVKGDKITSSSLFVKKKTYAFDYITMVKRGPALTLGGNLDTVIAYHDKKKLFRITEICAGFNVLVSRLESEGVQIIGGDKG
jgi:hypothetical protein